MYDERDEDIERCFGEGGQDPEHHRKVIENCLRGFLSRVMWHDVGSLKYTVRDTSGQSREHVEYSIGFYLPGKQEVVELKFAREEVEDLRKLQRAIQGFLAMNGIEQFDG